MEWVEQLGQFIRKIGPFRNIKSQVVQDKDVMKAKFVGG